MESSHSHEHQQVEDNHILVVDSSYCGLPWYHNHILNETGIDTSLRDVKQQSIHHHNMDLSGFSTENFGVYELQELARIKNELSVTGSCLDLHEIISFRPTFNNEDVINQDMLLKTLLKSDQFVNLIPSSAEPIFNASFVLPTLKVSHLNDQSTNFFDVKLPALHPFGYPTFNGSLNYEQSCPLSYNNGDQMKSRIEKRPAKANPAKKSKLELRPSCTPMKVRKEKLGDRILALQQMVAPFGKTDTASVLMEAIGYIKFLQNQVETLSMPYMNSTNCSSKISKEGGLTEDENEEAKRNLRSRGLCLLPLSCLTYVTYGGEQCLLGNNNNAASEHYF